MKSLIAAFVLGFCGLLVTTPVLARRPAEAPAPAHEMTFKGAIASADEDGILTLKNGKGAALEGLYYPQASRAKAWLNDHAGQSFTYSEVGTDRYGHLRLATSLTPSMLHDGAALIFSREEIPQFAGWMKEEEAARAKKLGVWNDPDLILADERTPNFIGSFHLVEGTVRHIYAAREATYLNFGDDWKTDFSIEVPKGARRNFGDTLGTIEGKKVRVRGMIYEDHGPMISINRPEQLEILTHDKK